VNIPYTTEPRADTGVTNVTLGIWLFLASEVMLFGAVFSAYALLRTAAVDWPSGREVLSLTLGGINTGALILATLFVWRARRVAGVMVRQNLATSVLFATVFLVVKALEYRGEIVAGLLPSTSTFLATYYVLTGLHAAHVIGGVIANVWTMLGIRRVGDAMTAGRTHALSLYWAFVDIVWLIILVLMYLS
jgi:heme/copper-type cytochrome/quinol oxidase subunit 3